MMQIAGMQGNNLGNLTSNSMAVFGGEVGKGGGHTAALVIAVAATSAATAAGVAFTGASSADVVATAVVAATAADATTAGSVAMKIIFWCCCFQLGRPSLQSAYEEKLRQPDYNTTTTQATT